MNSLEIQNYLQSIIDSVIKSYVPLFVYITPNGYSKAYSFVEKNGLLYKPELIDIVRKDIDNTIGSFARAKDRIGYIKSLIEAELNMYLGKLKNFYPNLEYDISLLAFIEKNFVDPVLPDDVKISKMVSRSIYPIYKNIVIDSINYLRHKFDTNNIFPEYSYFTKQDYLLNLLENATNNKLITVLIKDILNNKLVYPSGALIKEEDLFGLIDDYLPQYVAESFNDVHSLIYPFTASLRLFDKELIRFYHLNGLKGLTRLNMRRRTNLINDVLVELNRLNPNVYKTIIDSFYNSEIGNQYDPITSNNYYVYDIPTDSYLSINDSIESIINNNEHSLNYNLDDIKLNLVEVVRNYYKNDISTLNKFLRLSNLDFITDVDLYNAISQSINVDLDNINKYLYDVEDGWVYYLLVGLINKYDKDDRLDLFIKYLIDNKLYSSILNLDIFNPYRISKLQLIDIIKDNITSISKSELNNIYSDYTLTDETKSKFNSDIESYLVSSYDYLNSLSKDDLTNNELLISYSQQILDNIKDYILNVNKDTIIFDSINYIIDEIKLMYPYINTSYIESYIKDVLRGISLINKDEVSEYIENIKVNIKGKYNYYLLNNSSIGNNDKVYELFTTNEIVNELQNLNLDKVNKDYEYYKKLVVSMLLDKLGIKYITYNDLNKINFEALDKYTYISDFTSFQDNMKKFIYTQKYYFDIIDEKLKEFYTVMKDLDIELLPEQINLIQIIDRKNKIKNKINVLLDYIDEELKEYYLKYAKVKNNIDNKEIKRLVIYSYDSIVNAILDNYKTKYNLTDVDNQKNRDIINNFLINKGFSDKFTKPITLNAKVYIMLVLQAINELIKGNTLDYNVKNINDLDYIKNGGYDFVYKTVDKILSMKNVNYTPNDLLKYMKLYPYSIYNKVYIDYLNNNNPQLIDILNKSKLSTLYKQLPLALNNINNLLDINGVINSMLNIEVTELNNAKRYLLYDNYDKLNLYKLNNYISA